MSTFLDSLKQTLAKVHAVTTALQTSVASLTASVESVEAELVKESGDIELSTILDLMQASIINDTLIYTVIDDTQGSANTTYSSDKVTALLNALQSSLTSNVSEVAMMRLTNIRTVTDAAATLSLSDVGGYIRMQNASANTVTVPTTSTVAFKPKDIITIRQVGDGTTTIVAADGVVIHGTTLDLITKNSTVQLVCVADNVWDLVGAEAVS